MGEGSQIWHHCHLRAGAWIGDNSHLGKNVYVDDGGIVGDGCKIQNNVSIYRGVTLGNDVFVGPSAVFTNDLHPRSGSKTWVLVPTTIEQGATIGANATILAGVKVGRWAMIGAGSVVVADIGAHELVAGNPARHLGWVCACGHTLQSGEAALQSASCASCGRASQPGL